MRTRARTSCKLRHSLFTNECSYSLVISLRIIADVCLFFRIISHVWGFDSNQNGLYGINGVATLYQNISICPSSQYHFSFYVGWTGTAPYQASPGYAFNTTVAVYLNDALIVPTQLTCTDATQCNLPTVVNDTEAGYRLVTAPNLITPPPSGIGILKFVFIRASTAPGDPPLQDTILDYVTLTKVS